jgi:hypothetical protein
LGALAGNLQPSIDVIVDKVHSVDAAIVVGGGEAVPVVVIPDGRFTTWLTNAI